MTETWTVSADSTSATVTGREKVAFWKKLLPFWWFINSVEQNIAQAPWYMPTSPNWLRAIAWGLRNPLQNSRAFCGWFAVAEILAAVTAAHFYLGASWWWAAIAVIFIGGVQDCNYTVTGKAPIQTVQRNDLSPPQTGFQWCILHTPIPRPFVSYSGKHVVWYVGWQYNGFFGAKLNPQNSPVQVV
jgi:hypothetical protein